MGIVGQDEELKDPENRLMVIGEKDSDGHRPHHHLQPCLCLHTDPPRHPHLGCPGGDSIKGENEVEDAGESRRDGRTPWVSQ